VNERQAADEKLSRPRETRDYRIRDEPQGSSGRRIRVGAAVAVGAAAAFISWAVLGSRDGVSSSAETTPGTETSGPVALSTSGLGTLAGAIGQPIYWLGPAPNGLYELTQSGGARIYVRYLPKGVDAGDRRPFRTVGTYPLENAYAITEATSKNQGSVPIPVGDGAAAFYGTNAPSSAYIAFRGSGYQIEVFDPTPGAAAKLVQSGAVTAVPVTADSGAAKAVSPAELKAEAARRNQPIYWAGPEPGETYELSVTSSGRVFVRYLPDGVEVGDPKAFRTVATYPLADAFAATQALANNPNKTRIDLANGGIGVFDKTGRTNVYVAYPDSEYQIEVFDPTPGNAPTLVRSGQIVPVG
jgi:hypothetical protein